MTAQQPDGLTEAVAPCPFCGAQMEHRFQYWSHPAKSPCFLAFYGVPDEAIATWNTRAMTARPTAEPTEAMALPELAERKWRELDVHRTSVICGAPDDFYGDDPRINIFDEKVDEGKAPRCTVGLYLGDGKWAMSRFSPEQLLGVVGLVLSKPSVKAVIERAGAKP